MNELETLSVVINATTEPLRNALTQVRQELNSLRNNTQSVTRSIGNSFRNVVSRINAVKLAITAAIAGIIKFASSCIELGSDLAEVQNVVDVTFTSMSSRINKFANDAITTFGLSETVAKKYVGTLGAMAKSFGFVGDELYEMSTTLTGLTGDVASFYNLSTDEAFTKLKSVFTGETESLKDLGVVMTQTALDNYALANGYGKTTSQMTEQEKVALRYKFVLEQLSDASGDFANTADSWANQTRVLSLQFDQLKASIGQGLINIFNPVLKVINTVISKLRILADGFKTFTEVFFGSSANGDSDTISTETASAAQSSETLAENMAQASTNAKETKKSLQGFDEIHTLDSDSDTSTGIDTTPNVDSGVSFGSIDTGELDASIGGLKAKFEKIKAVLLTATKGIRSTLSACFKGIGKLIEIVADRIKNSGLKNLKTAFENLAKALGRLYKALEPVINLIVYVATLIGGVVVVVVGEVINIILNIIAVVVDVVAVIIDVIVEIVNTIIWFFENWNSIWNAVKDVIDIVCSFMGDCFSNLWTFIENTFKNIGKWFSDRFTEAWNGIKNVWNGAGQFFSGVWSSIKGAFSNVTGWFKDTFSKAWSAVLNVFNAGGKIFVGIKEGIVGVFETVVNGLIDGINKVIKIPFEKINEALNGIRDISILGAKPFSGLWSENPISIPQIPKLAKGGIVNSPTLAMIGEAGQEAVMPLKNNTSWISDLATQISSRMSNSNVNAGNMNVELVLNGKKFAQATIKDFEAEANRKGGLKVKLV